MPAARKTKKPDLSQRLLAWYDVHRRVLPWRAPKGKRADPYRVWLSEIMLQQTTVQAVGNYYRKFLVRWPDVKALAGARQDEVLAAWAGLGYYARARNLHAAAKVVAYEMDGKFPATAEALRALPGIGAYTSGAIAAIAYDERQAAMDANAERVIARLYAVATPMPKAKAQLHVLCSALVPERAGDFVQALMDLGSAICTPKRPACGNCPWTDYCLARQRGIQEQLPIKALKMARPLRRGAAFVVRDRSGAVLLVQRPDKGLLASMLEPPLGPWSEDFPSPAKALKQAPFEAEWKRRPGIVRHGFTHFELEIEVYVAEVTKRPTHICHPRPSAAKAARGEGDPGRQKRRGVESLGSLPSARETRASPGMTFWISPSKLHDVALPTVMRKIVEHGLDEGGPLFTRNKL
jgi:A/G-specific adenine glycosylase